MSDRETLARCRRIWRGIPTDGLFAVGQASGAPCRIGPAPLALPNDLINAIGAQGRLWLKFLKASHSLYLASLKGAAPKWVADYLGAGKPDRLLEFGRMNRFKRHFSPVLRPDLLLTEGGAFACELDSVPGGIGLLACLSRLYAAEGFRCLGERDGMLNGFWAAMEHAAGKQAPRTAIVVSDESRMYRPEMRWLADSLAARGSACRAFEPEELDFSLERPTAPFPDGDGAVDLIYRFFELFDLENVPNAALILEAAKLKRVRLTPPAKPHLEEKLLFALLHHPMLAGFWREEFGPEAFSSLKEIVMPTWIMDSRPLPPHATVAGLEIARRPLNSWDALKALSKRERELVIKPSGFSQEAWGSHGVRFGADMPQDSWAAAVEHALGSFPDQPWLLQPYIKPALTRVPYYDPDRDSIGELEGRVRLCPYYFLTTEDDVSLGGVLATVCPADKRAIHGMPEALMLPCVASGE